MDHDDFTAALEAELQLHGRPFSRLDVLDFSEACWSMIEDNPDPARWAEPFRQATAGVMA